MYLDPDDWLGTNTIENVCKFFDKHYDEIDVVTYNIIPIRDGVEEEPHFRYEILQEECAFFGRSGILAFSRDKKREFWRGIGLSS